MGPDSSDGPGCYAVENEKRSFDDSAGGTYNNSFGFEDQIQG